MCSRIAAQGGGDLFCLKENDIEFARREVRVAMPGADEHDELTPEQQAALQAAASGAVQAQVDQEQKT